MEQLRKARAPLRASFTKRAKELSTLLDDENRDDIVTQAVFEAAKEKHEVLQDKNDAIYNFLLEDKDVTEDDLLAEMDVCDDYNRTYRTLSLKFQKLLACPAERPDALECRSTASSVIQSVRTSIPGTILSHRPTTADSLDSISKRKFKLPTIDLIKFSGDAREWLAFWSQFVKIDQDDEIDPSDKIQYLKQATTLNSRARRLVESYPAVGANYSKIVDALKSRFGREELQIEIHIRELLKLILLSSAKQADITSLYDSIETHIRALETMGVTTDRYAAILFPLVESCLPEELLRLWHRSACVLPAACDTNSDTLKLRLSGLLSFLRNEVENEQRVVLTQEGLGSGRPKKHESATRTKESGVSAPTATALINHESGCIFCKGTHSTEHCNAAKKMTYEKKKQLLAQQGACFRCIRRGHMAMRCKVKIDCLLCDKHHSSVMCPRLNESPKEEETQKNMSNRASTSVFLQTMRVNVSHDGKSKNVRVLMDSGSQGSYILDSTADKLGLKSRGTETLIHSLFGGSLSKEERHHLYEAKVCNGDYECCIQVLGQKKICGDIAAIHGGDWTQELAAVGIKLSDTSEAGAIEMLLGADVIGGLLTGEQHNLQCGLTAIRTKLGWTLMGKVPATGPRRDHTLLVHSLLMADCTIKNLWELDVLGIEDPSERVSKAEAAAAAKELFLKIVTVDAEGRYEVSLPWLVDHPNLPPNRQLPEKRLESSYSRLKKNGHVNDYCTVFNEWKKEGVIEEVINITPESNLVHYLPHRAVIKENSTTKLRPVFDASARVKEHPALNDCLEKGPNLIEQIPKIILRFRLHKVGVIADIKKAFLQISIKESDRDALRFLWLEGDQLKVYRHRLRGELQSFSTWCYIGTSSVWHT